MPFEQAKEGEKVPVDRSVSKERQIVSRHVEKKSVDYDDTEFLQKMFSNKDADIKILNKNTDEPT